MQEKHLCIVGIDKHWIEKDVIKFIRKAFTTRPVIAGEEHKEPLDDIPLKGVAKKRGKTFGFLQFNDMKEKHDFTE